jgi:hypothetical protein
MLRVESNRFPAEAVDSHEPDLRCAFTQSSRCMKREDASLILL